MPRSKTFSKLELMRIAVALKDTHDDVVISRVYRRHSKQKQNLYKTEKIYVPSSDTHPYGHFIGKSSYVGKLAENEEIPQSYFIDMSTFPERLECYQASRCFSYGKALSMH